MDKCKIFRLPDEVLTKINRTFKKSHKDRCDIFHLPDEILEKIFSYLNKEDRLNSSLVCKHWLKILDHPMFLKDIYFKIELDINAIMSRQVKFSRNFFNFIFVTHLTEQHLQFLKEYSEHIRLLEFRNSEIKKNVHIEECDHIVCEQVNVLKFNFGFFSIFQSLPNLKELYITYQAGYDICDYDVFKYRNTMLNLEKLVLIHPVATRDVVIKRFYPGNIEWSENPSKQILTFPAILDFVETRKRTLTAFDIKCDLQAKAALKLSQIINLKLKRLSLAGCPECINVLPEICKNQRSLIDLDLSGLIVKDEIISSICNSLPLLESLNMDGNSSIDISIENIFDLKHLNILVLDCWSIKTETFKRALDVFQLYNLSGLSLYSARFEGELLRSLLKLITPLHSLTLCSCANVSDETVHVISKNLVFLRYLSLGGCREVTDDGIFCSQDAEQSLMHIKGLQELFLGGCLGLNYHGLIKAIKFTELHTLTISLYDLKKLDIKERLKKHNPTLRITDRINVFIMGNMKLS